MLGSLYEPEEHWTSKLRGKAGYSPFYHSMESYSTFTIADHSGKFTALMARGHPDIEDWAVTPPKWHLEVKTTSGNQEAEFTMTNAQLDRVCTELMMLFPYY
jgi:hypothetical protein